MKDCKIEVWWQLLKIKTYLVPLLQGLTGIGINIINHFNYLANKDVECLYPAEITIWHKAGLYKKMIETNTIKRDGRKRIGASNILQLSRVSQVTQPSLC